MCSNFARTSAVFSNSYDLPNKSLRLATHCSIIHAAMRIEISPVNKRLASRHPSASNDHNARLCLCVYVNDMRRRTSAQALSELNYLGREYIRLRGEPLPSVLFSLCTLILPYTTIPSFTDDFILITVWCLTKKEISTYVCFGNTCAYKAHIRIRILRTDERV